MFLKMGMASLLAVWAALGGPRPRWSIFAPAPQKSGHCRFACKQGCVIPSVREGLLPERHPFSLLVCQQVFAPLNSKPGRVMGRQETVMGQVSGPS